METYNKIDAEIFWQLEEKEFIQLMPKSKVFIT